MEKKQNKINENRLNKSPIIYYTKTQTTGNTQIPLSANAWGSYSVLRNDNQDKFKTSSIMYNKSFFKCIQSESLAALYPKWKSN